MNENVKPSEILTPLCDNLLNLLEFPNTDIEYASDELASRLRDILDRHDAMLRALASWHATEGPGHKEEFDAVGVAARTFLSTPTPQPAPTPQTPTHTDELATLKSRLAEVERENDSLKAVRDTYSLEIRTRTAERNEWKRKHDTLKSRLAEVEAERDRLDSALRQLMAIMHGDGGHYVAVHGLSKAFDDAIALFYKMRQELEKAKPTPFIAPGEDISKQVIATHPPQPGTKEEE